MNRVIFKLLTTLQNALDLFNADNKHLREEIYDTHKRNNMVLNQIEDVIDLDEYSYEERMRMIRTITNANKIELSNDLGRRFR